MRNGLPFEFTKNKDVNQNVNLYLSGFLVNGKVNLAFNWNTQDKS